VDKELRIALLGSVVFLTGLGGIACSSSDKSEGGAATNDDYDDVAQSLGVAVATGNGGGDVGSLSDSVDIAVGLPPLDVTLKAAGEFTGIRAGVSYDYKLECKNTAGATLDACNVETDDAAAQVTWSGDLALPNFAASVDRQGQWQLSNLKSGTAVFSGSGDLTFDAKFQSSFRNVERNYHLSYSADYVDVKVQVLPRLVVGGTIHYAVDAERIASSNAGDSSAKFSMDADVVFGADGGATLTLDATHRYNVNATTGVVVRVQ
jgi:hypothetical protein